MNLHAPAIGGFQSASGGDVLQSTEHFVPLPLRLQKGDRCHFMFQWDF